MKRTKHLNGLMLCLSGKIKLRPLLLAAVLISLNGCTTGNCNTPCPSWAYAGDDVAQELEGLPEQDYPHLWEWLQRLEKLQKQLEISNG